MFEDTWLKSTEEVLKKQSGMAQPENSVCCGRYGEGSEEGELVATYSE